MAVAALALIVPVLGFAPRDPANAMPVSSSSAAAGFASLRMHHVSLCVADRAAARAWYCGKLGFVAAAADGGLLERDGVRIRLVESAAKGPGGSVAFEVDDTTAAAASLQDRGVCVEYVGTVEAKQFSVTDPDGNVVRFLPRDVI
jgi:catechol 2,3-dioxygenase-like lactoylglutathione lyase family enzyme